MSEHDVDESGTNRAFLSVALVLAVIGIAAVATKAAPHAADAQPANRKGVLVEVDGTVHDGTLLIRGGAITLIQERREQLFPRSQVLLFEEDFDRSTRPEGVLVTKDGRVLRGHLLNHDGELWLLRGKRATVYPDYRYVDAQSSELGADYYQQFPPQSHKTHDDRAKSAEPGVPANSGPGPALQVGCVVLESGDVLVGALVHKGDSVEVRHTNGVVTVVPEAAIRWTGMGTTQPTDAYWKLHSDKPIDPRHRRKAAVDALTPTANLSHSQKYWIQAAKNPKVARALEFNSGGEWGKASELWLELYTEFHKTPFLQNYTNCVSKWIEAKVLRLHRDELLRRINSVISTARTNGLVENPQFKAEISKTLERVIRQTNRSGHVKTAHDVTTLMSSLGEDYKTKAEALWRSLPAPRINLEQGH